MPKTLIEQFPKEKREAAKDGSGTLLIAEYFCDTIQGENFAGNPASFLRLQGCTLDCVWCDTLEVWRKGNPYSVTEVLDLIEAQGMIEKYRNGQRFVLTGGSPLKQQEGLISFIEGFVARFGFKPYFEIENEAVRMPHPKLIEYVDCWNNSPKLANSMMKERARYKPDCISAVASLPNSWFKFVVSQESDWEEIKRDYLDTGLIKKEQIVLMPEGVTRLELQAHYNFVVDICVRENIRFSDRTHITIWEKQTGV